MKLKPGLYVLVFIDDEEKVISCKNFQQCIKVVSKEMDKSENKIPDTYIEIHDYRFNKIRFMLSTIFQKGEWHSTRKLVLLLDDV